MLRYVKAIDELVHKVHGGGTAYLVHPYQCKPRAGKGQLPKWTKKKSDRTVEPPFLQNGSVAEVLVFVREGFTVFLLSLGEQSTDSFPV